MNIVKSSFSVFAICFCLSLAFLSSERACAETSGPSARPEEIATSPQWLRLLHMRSLRNGKFASRIQGHAFFLSPDGEHNPLAELRADIARGATLACEFPARYMVLAKIFNWPLTPLDECRSLRDWRDQLDANSLWVVYTTQYLSNPSSAFGHSFLRFTGGTHDEMLDLTLGYAAVVPEGVSSFTYVYSGLTGGFPGEFSTVPFFAKLREYNEQESRSLWQYRINFSASEFDLVAAHIFELQSKAFAPYYFLDDNCSLMLLEALSVARPQFDFTKQFGIYVLPIDTVKALIRSGWVSEIRHLPSLRGRLASKFDQLNSDQRSQFADLKDDWSSSHTRTTDPRVLETLLDYYDYKRNSSGGRQSESEKSAYREILLTRARTPGKIEWSGESADLRLAPHESADPHWWGLSAGGSSGGGFLQAEFVPGVHNLMGRDEGYVRFSEIEILGGKARLYSSNGATPLQPLQIESLNIFSMTNLVPYEPYDKEFSWRANVSVTPRKEIGRADIYRAAFAPAFGYGLGSGAIYTYALAVSSFESGEFSGPSATWYLGPEVGGVYTPREHLKISLVGRHLIAAVAAPEDFNRSQVTLKAFYSPNAVFDYGFESLATTSNAHFPVNWSEMNFVIRSFF